MSEADSSSFRFATRAVHAGAEPEPVTGAIMTPIFQTSTFVFRSPEEGAARFAGLDPGYIYTRMGNPTIAALEESVAALEDGTGALATASGMAAVSTVFFALLSAGDHVVCSASVYGPSRVVLERDFSRFGIQATMVDTSDIGLLKAAITESTRIVFVETPANPTLAITDLEVAEVAAEVGSIVPGRLVHDFAGALLRFENGARGSFWVTQAAAGVENCLRIRVSGTQGSLEWMQEFPQALTFKPLHGPSQNRTPNGPGTLPLAARACRIVAGHPEGFHEGFANIYSDAAEAIAARRSGKQAHPLALYFPNSLDGLLGVRFVASVVESSNANGKWVTC